MDVGVTSTVSTGVNGVGVKATSGVNTSTLKVQAETVNAISINKAANLLIPTPHERYCLKRLSRCLGSKLIGLFGTPSVVLRAAQIHFHPTLRFPNRLVRGISTRDSIRGEPWIADSPGPHPHLSTICLVPIRGLRRKDGSTVV